MQNESGYKCSFCNKQFLQESTHKRHYYYCRLKQLDPVSRRKRSCAACSRAKTRCNLKLPKCSKCQARGIICTYEGKVPSPEVGQKEQSYDPLNTNPDGQSNQQFLDSADWTSLDLPNLLDNIGSSQGPHEMSYLSETIVSENDKSYSSLFPVDLVRNRGILEQILMPNISSRATNKLWNAWDSDNCLYGRNIDLQLMPHPWSWTSLLSFEITRSPPMLGVVRSFSSRSLTKERSQVQVFSLTRVLHSYLYMLQRKETFPPFVNPLLYSWAEEGKCTSLEPLLNCTSLVKMFIARTESNKKFIWKLIRNEHERLWLQHENFDKLELLAAMQAQLIYVIMRLVEGETEDNNFDMEFLASINAISIALCEKIDLRQSINTIPDIELEWQDWTLHESRRRTGLVFKIINMLVDIDYAITCTPIPGFVFIPLPTKKTLWESTTADVWKSEFDSSTQTKELFGLSDDGDLVRVYQKNYVIHSDVTSWEKWYSEMDGIGNLVMLMSSL